MPSTPEPRPQHPTGDQSDEAPSDLGWEDVRAEVSRRWPRLNEHDLNALASESAAFVAGNHQLLIGRLRERYGLDQSHAEDEIRQFVRSLDPSLRSSPERQHSTTTLGPGHPLGMK